MKFLPVLFGILVAETGIADFENGVWTNGYATSDNQDGFFILKRSIFQHFFLESASTLILGITLLICCLRYEYDVEGGYCNFNVAATGTVRLEEILCYELTTGSTYEDEFYSFAVPRCRALDRFYDDAFETDGTLADDAKAFTIFEVISLTVTSNFCHPIYKMTHFRNSNVVQKQ